MNCVKVQEAIWCGELTNEMLQHISTCEACDSEQRKVRQLSYSLEDVRVPVQSRSLLPSTREIEQVLRSRKRQRFTKWGLGGAAAAACVLVAVTVVPTWMNSTAKQSGAGNPVTGSTGSMQTPSTAIIAVGTDRESSGSASTSTEADVSGQTGAGEKPFVEVASDNNQQDADLFNNAAAYLNKVSDHTLIKHITLTHFELDAKNSDAKNISGQLTLMIEHQTGQSSAYGSGTVRVTRFVHFTMQQGLWTVTDGLTTSPFILNQDGAVAGWHEVDVTVDHVKKASFQVPGTIDAKSEVDGSVTFTQQGKVIGSLQIEGQGPHDAGDYANAVMLPNHSSVVDKQVIASDKSYLHIVQFSLSTDAPAANPDMQPPNGTRVYFMRDDKLAYDLNFANGSIDADTLKQMINSFDIMP